MWCLWSSRRLAIINTNGLFSFGVSADVAMQVVAVGFIIGVIQDSVETALNSAGDVMFAVTAEYTQWKREGKSLPTFLGGETQVEI